VGGGLLRHARVSSFGNAWSIGEEKNESKPGNSKYIIGMSYFRQWCSINCPSLQAPAPPPQHSQMTPNSISSLSSIQIALLDALPITLCFHSRLSFFWTSVGNMRLCFARNATANPPILCLATSNAPPSPRTRKRGKQAAPSLSPPSLSHPSNSILED
jgi:hypothetical protein